MSEVGFIRPSVEIAAALSSKVSLKHIGCVGIEAKIISGAEPEQLSYKVDNFTVRWHLDDRSLKVFLPFGLSASNGLGSQAIVLASFAVLLRADYLIRDGEDVELDMLPHYAGIMGYMHTWPYFRSEVQYLSTKIGLPPLVLPVVVSGQVPPRIFVSMHSMEDGDSGAESASANDNATASAGEPRQVNAGKPTKRRTKRP